MALWKLQYWIEDKRRKITLWIKRKRPITKSDRQGMELLFVLYATNLSAVNIKEVSQISRYYQDKYTGAKVNKYFESVAVKHSRTDAYRLSNLAWGHIQKEEEHGKSK